MKHLPFLCDICLPAVYRGLKVGWHHIQINYVNMTDLFRLFQLPTASIWVVMVIEFYMNQI